MVRNFAICPAELAYAFGELVGGGENRLRLLVEQQMVIAEMPAADVPVEILGLQVEREGIRQQHVRRAGYLVDSGLRQIGRPTQIRTRPKTGVKWRRTKETFSHASDQDL
jgi:hypothetical protein